MDKAKIVYEYIKTVVMRACCVFTFTCLLLYSFINLFKSSSDSDKLLFNNSYFTYILVFSLVIGLASLILKIKAIPKALAIAINYVVATVDFILVMEVWTGISTTSKQILFGAIGFSIIYALVMGVFALGRFIVKKIKINSWTESQLANHPYIGKELARFIYKYRSKHNIQSSQDIRDNTAIDVDYTYLEHYISFE